MSIYKYQRITTPGPNGTTLHFRNTEDNAYTELVEIDGWHYVYVPDDVVIAEQPSDIQWQPAEITADLKEQIKANSRRVQLITEEIQRRIREKYTLEDEQYFSRIGVGVALGAYTFQPGEEEELLAFGGFVESVRQWGRAERGKIGL